MSAILFLKKLRMGFPALAEPQKSDDGKEAYGAKLIVKPDDPAVKALDAAIEQVAREKWKDEADSVLAMLRDKDRICLVKKEYRDKQGKVYAGFEGSFYLSTRNSKEQPTCVDRFGGELTKRSDIERILYSGCVVNAKVEIWAQDNNFGRRVNCTLLGVMFAADGESFGGGAARAAADEFADMVEDSAEDLV